MNICLVEQWKPGIQFPKNAKIIALTAEVIYQMDKYDITFQPMEDYYNSGDLRGDTDQYLDEQLQWFDRFDQYLQSIYPEAQKKNIRLATIFQEPLKYRIDNVILTCKILRQLRESENPSKIYFYGDGARKLRFRHDFKFLGESVFSLIIENFCQRYNIDYEKRDVEIKQGQKLNEYKIQNLYKNIIKRLKKNQTIVNTVKTAQFILNIQKKNTKLSKTTKKGRILFLNYDAQIEKMYLDLKTKGFDVLIRQRESIYSVDNVFSLHYRNCQIFKNSYKETFSYKSNDWKEAFFESEVFQWIVDRCDGVNMQKILAPIFKLFIAEYCPATIRKIAEFTEFFNTYDIDYVANQSHTLASDSASGWCVNYYAAVAAAQLSQSTISVGISHGWDAFEFKSRFCNLTTMHDIYIFATREEVEQEEYFKKYFNASLPLAYSAPYFKEARHEMIESNKFVRPIGYNKFSGKPLVLFVPVMMITYCQRVVDKGQSFPLEYLEWHKALIDYMATRQDFNFVWKGMFLTGQGNFDIIQTLINEKNINNVKFVSDKLMPWLNVVDRVVCDIPSTAFYEAMCANKPVMTFCRSREAVTRINAKSSLRSSLQAYSTISEGIECVKRFLNDEPEKYIVQTNTENDDIGTILRSYIDRKEEILNKRDFRWRNQGAVKNTKIPTSCDI